jgi:hypothetical protein
MQFAEPNSTTVCDQPNPGETLGEKLVTGGQQPPGSQFMIGVTPLADNERYLLSSAALQTTSGTFVAPDNATLQATAALLQPDPSTDTWPIPYGDFESSSGSGAYPGTMVVYAAIPTTGLPATAASEYASFLQFAATTGQTTGVGVGQLPPGYLPLTPADGLGALAAYTQAAALDVAAQNGQIPPMTPTAPASASTGNTGSSSEPGQAAGFDDTFGSSAGLSGIFGQSLLTDADLRAATQSHGKAAAAPARVELVSSALSPIQALLTSGFPLALVFGLGAIGAVFVPLTYRVGRRRGRW